MAWRAIIHQEMRTVFVAEINTITAHSAPVLMWHDSGNRNIVFFHQVSSQPSGSVKRLLSRIAFVFTHFNTDRMLIAWSIVIGMLTLLVSR